MWQPGETKEIDEEIGAEIVAAHPAKMVQVGDETPASAPEPVAENRQMPVAETKVIDKKHRHHYRVDGTCVCGRKKKKE